MVQIDTSTKLSDQDHGCPHCQSRDWRLFHGQLSCHRCGRVMAGVMDLDSGEYFARGEIEFVGPEAVKAASMGIAEESGD